MVALLPAPPDWLMLARFPLVYWVMLAALGYALVPMPDWVMVAT
jgi:hypothetical protein